MCGATYRGVRPCCNAVPRCCAPVGAWPSTTMWSASPCRPCSASICALWRFPSVETPQSYLEAVRAAGLRLRYHADTSAYAVRFYTRLLAVYRERRAEFEAMRGPERYLEGLERLQMSQQLATTGVLG